MNTRMQFLEHELAVEGRDQQMKASAAAASSAPAVSEIVRLEHRINALEAMVNGLTDEVLDLKTITRKLTDLLDKLGNTAPASPVPPRSGIRRPPVEPSRETEPSPAVGRVGIQAQLPTQEQEKRQISSPAASRAVQQNPPAPADDPAPVSVAESADTDNGRVEYVMQPDGSILKRPKTQGVENVIIAGTGFGKSKISRSSAIRAESSAVIEADEVEETVELNGKRK